MNPIAPPLLAWFYKNQRSLPFRTQPSPYRVWVSEIMLQQTRVAADGCAPAGCVWADEAALAGEYALPGAFKAYRKRMMQG